jgi:hypothetical protein
MLYAYLYLPAPRVTIHSDPNCGSIRKQRKRNQRSRSITAQNAPAELRAFEENQHHFAPNADSNDMWLTIDLGDDARERRLVDAIHRALARHYTRFSRATPKDCAFCLPSA